MLPHTLTEITGPVFGASDVAPSDHDLNHQHAGESLGERIIVNGRVRDENTRPVPRTLIELWHANAAGRYRHSRDEHDAPWDPNFTGFGRALSDAEGRYRFITIKPGAYPWRNHHNAWRPAHIHFSWFGPAFVTRLVTQMYFPGDPLLAFDPIFNSTADERARSRLIAAFNWEKTTPECALGTGTWRFVDHAAPAKSSWLCGGAIRRRSRTRPGVYAARRHVPRTRTGFRRLALGVGHGAGDRDAHCWRTQSYDRGDGWS